MKSILVMLKCRTMVNQFTIMLDEAFRVGVAGYEVKKMQFVFLCLIFIQMTITVYAFRDHPANYSNRRASLNDEKIQISNNRTVYEKSFVNILTRKKRGFVFFKGAVVVLTQVLSKHIVATAPRGVIHSSEVDLFYDLPILIEGWKKPLDAFVNHTKAGGKKSDQFVDVTVDEKFKNVGVINASAIPYDKYYRISQGPPYLNRFILNNRNTNWNKINRFNQKSWYRKPYIKGPSRYYNYYPKYHRRNFKQIRYPDRKFVQNQITKSPSRTLNQYYPNPQRFSTKTKTVNPFWHDHREYRERRGIFEHVEGFGKKLGIRLRSCILRAICEIKTELLPVGESLINDVARILFTIPTNHDSKDDDFVQMALEDGVNCERRFMVSCPHSPLKYFFNNFRATNLPPMSEQDMMRNLMYA